MYVQAIVRGARTGGLLVVAAVIGACHGAGPGPGSDPGDTGADAGSGPPDAAAVAPCTLALGVGAPSTGTCTASWRAMDAGSVSNFTHVRATITGTGIAGDPAAPWSLALASDYVSALGDFTVDLTINGQLQEVRGPGTPAVPEPWYCGSVPPGVNAAAACTATATGVTMHVTAASIEQYAYSHFDTDGVHGSFDLDAPIVLHARF